MSSELDSTAQVPSANQIIHKTRSFNYEVSESKEHPWMDLPSTAFYDPNKDPLEVACNVVVLNLGDISTATLCYRMRLELWVAWALTEEEVRGYIEDPVMWNPIIHPDPVPWTISIEDMKKMVFLSGRTTQVFMWRGKVMACECTLVTARYIESMELENFPLDCQHFNFHIGIRCDNDMPLKLEGNRIKYNTLESHGGYLNFDGRSMRKFSLNSKGCCFNVRTQLLSLEEFELVAIECEIENSETDIPFLHCSMRLSRNFFPYIFRIFLPIFIIMINSTFSYRFAPGLMDSRLNYVVTNLLTIVAFFFIINTMLPAIPYLTIVDRYMSFSLVYVIGVAIVCLFLEYYGLEGDQIEAGIFIFSCVGLVIGHFLLGCYMAWQRGIEEKKLHMTRHQVHDYTEKFRKLDEEEFLVHTDIHPVDKHNCYEGTLRNKIYPTEAAGWLNEGGGRLL